MPYRKVSVVLNEEQAEMLAIQAAESGESLSAFLRGRIFARESIEAELQSLQSSLLAAITEAMRGARPPESPPLTGGNGDARVLGLLVEMVMLLRGLSSPGKVQAARAEVQRLGFAPFG